MGRNKLHIAGFFPPKDSVYFLINTTQFKSADLFFPETFFPPKDLIFFRKFFSAF